MENFEVVGSPEHARIRPSQTKIQSTSTWDRLRDEIDDNKRWILACLYSLLVFLGITVKKSIPDYRINRIREQSDIPLSVFEKRKRLMGIVFAVDSQGCIHVNHVPLLHALVPLLPRRPFLASRRAHESLRLRVDTVDLIPDQLAAGQAPAASASTSQAEASDRTTCSSTNDDRVYGTCVVALRELLLGRKIYFIPLEADVGFVRADIKFRAAFFKQDLGEYLVSRGLAVTNESSFSPHRPTHTDSSFHYLRARIAHKRVG